MVKSDPDNMLLRTGAHMPLAVFLGRGSYRSAMSVVRRQARSAARRSNSRARSVHWHSDVREGDRPSTRAADAAAAGGRWATLRTPRWQGVATATLRTPLWRGVATATVRVPRGGGGWSRQGWQRRWQEHPGPWPRLHRLIIYEDGMRPWCYRRLVERGPAWRHSDALLFAEVGGPHFVGHRPPSQLTNA